MPEFHGLNLDQHRMYYEKNRKQALNLVKKAYRYQAQGKETSAAKAFRISDQYAAATDYHRNAMDTIRRIIDGKKE